MDHTIRIKESSHLRELKPAYQTSKKCPPRETTREGETQKGSINMNNTTTIRPKFGRVLPTLPTVAPTVRKRNHWDLVAEECRRHPNQWIEVTIPALTVDRHKHVPRDINRGKIAAFKGREYRACYRDRALWVMYSTALAELAIKEEAKEQTR